MRGSVIAGCLIALAASVSAAKPSLRDIEPIETGLFSIAVADKIRKECGSIAGRIFKARGELWSLYRLARAHGYTDEEIEAYVTADAEKNRMRAKRDAYLAAQGVVKSNPETYCAAGRVEIRKGSRIGVLLRD
jgi:hypothetical protein